MIHGHCDERFAPVGAAFAANFAERGERGAALTIVLAGEVVVDLWGGVTDAAGTRPWRPNTLVNAYSVGKPMVATLLLQLVDAGTVDLDEPVAAYWPEFAAAGKSAATLRQALCHRAGVPAIREPLTDDDLWDFDTMCAAVAATAPWWPPGERHAYHTNTYGHLVGGIVRHATGELPGTALARLARDIEADVHVGLTDDQHHRCAEVTWAGPLAPPSDPASLAGFTADQQMTLLGYTNPPGYSSMGVVNTPEWRRAQVPSTNGHMSARGVARFYDALLHDEVLSNDLLAEATRAQSSGPCPTLGQDVAFGLGFRPTTANRRFGPGPAGFGHHGTGGSLGFADPVLDLAVGYVTKDVGPGWQSDRNRALAAALAESVTAADQGTPG
jgi:CubicO group peptidase (beta-lactamase class C family)